MRLCAVVLAIIIFVLQQSNSKADKSSCDVFQGSWVRDSSSTSSLYNYSSCPFIKKDFNCQKNGRSDELYLKYKWQPHSCSLSRFDGIEFLRRYKGKSIMFVGDSLSRNQWESLVCMLYTAVAPTNYNLDQIPSEQVSIFTFKDYEVKVMLDHTLFLVDVTRDGGLRILKLDSIKGGNNWKKVGTLIFNTWHWWNRRGDAQPWDYIQVNGQLYKDMDRIVAFEKALNTWATWVDTNVDPAKTRVYFLGISPSHYNGSEWNEPRAKSCVGQREPVAGSPGRLPLPPALAVVKRVLRKMKKPVELLGVTNLSLLRKDGHPSIYGLSGTDCTHWCLPGLPDTWNLILYNLIF